MQKFSVELLGAFHTFTLLDSRGREVHTLADAIESAENEYGEQWSSVFNGAESIARSDWLALSALKSGDKVRDRRGNRGKVTLTHRGEFLIRWENGATGSFTLRQLDLNGIFPE
jgi:hypothetical protein